MCLQEVGLQTILKRNLSLHFLVGYELFNVDILFHNVGNKWATQNFQAVLTLKIVHEQIKYWKGTAVTGFLIHTAAGSTRAGSICCGNSGSTDALAASSRWPGNHTASQTYAQNPC